MDRRDREVALVALQAAVLSRRIFLPAAEPSDLGPEQWQVLIAARFLPGWPPAPAHA